MSSRKIIHVDMDAFYAAIEQRDNPGYRNRPLIVGGSPDARGVVATCSYEARKFGIHSAMPSSTAQRLCPEGIFVYPRIPVYRQVSEKIHGVFRQYTDRIEPLSLDEAYLDVSESSMCKGSATLIAEDIRQKIYKETRLTASAGISYNKFLAKMASDINKPNGQCVILPDASQAFIDNLAIGKFFGIGKATEARIQQLNIYNGHDLRQCSREFLVQHFGKAGSYYYAIARGDDNREVVSSRVRKSLGSENTFSEDLRDVAHMLHYLELMTTELLQVLKNKNLTAMTFTIKVKYHNFQQVTRSLTLDEPVTTLEQILPLLPFLLNKTDASTTPVRLLGVSFSSLMPLQSEDDIHQLNLFE